MIQHKTVLKVVDNSGAKIVKCIKVLGGLKKKVAKLGDVLVVVVKEIRNRSKQKSKVKKKEVCNGIIIRTKKSYDKYTGFIIKFNQNAVILISKQGNIIGNRIIGPISNKLPKTVLQKIAAISSIVL